MTEETRPQILPEATGFAAREALVVIRKHKIATATLGVKKTEDGQPRTYSQQFFWPTPCPVYVKNVPVAL